MVFEGTIAEVDEDFLLDGHWQCRDLYNISYIFMGYRRRISDSEIMVGNGMGNFVNNKALVDRCIRNGAEYSLA